MKIAFGGVRQLRFLELWSIEDIGAAFLVKDSAGQKLGIFNFKDEPGRRSSAKPLTKDEAHRIAQKP